MAQNLKILIGADPELFLEKSGTYLSAHDLLPGTKRNPYPVPGGAIQVDGVAAEFNIDPADNPQDFVLRCQAMMTAIKGRLPEGVFLRPIPTATFKEEYFKSLPEDTRELGCNPDYNAWTGGINDRPDGEHTTMRTAAGHIHIGWTKDADVNDETHYEDCMAVIRQLDYFLGCYSLMWDKDDLRRSLYGKAGSFRPKSYGCEYRGISAAWLQSPDLMKWVYSAAQRGAHLLINKGHSAEAEFGSLARDTIDSGDRTWWQKECHPLYRLTQFTGMTLPSIPYEMLHPPKAEVKPVLKKRKAKVSFDLEARGDRLAIGEF